MLNSFEDDLALNNPQEMICHKTPTNELSILKKVMKCLKSYLKINVTVCEIEEEINNDFFFF